ncbi:transcriptional regulator [Streptomyces sp. NPDC052109]|uniref:transcriptional regulator n=1 Tax=Streptomyces sp. NPDC052109 TaxID=3155527 RepID=UPI0034336CFE
MTASAGDLLRTTTGALAPDPEANAFVPLVESGEASPRALARLALEQRWVIPADRRSFEHLARRADPAPAAFFTTLATGEELAARHLTAFARGCGVTGERARTYVPLAGCQAYPAYVSWLALVANFSAWGGYCARIAAGLRTHYGFTDESCAFFDFFAAPAPELDRQATEAVQAGLDTGTLDPDSAHTYGTLLQRYERMFWETVGQSD